MSLSPGTQLGPYKVIAPLGAGGMGEVYRAQDPRLERDVAVKILPERLLADPQALARFERETKVVAALSHPNILAIFDTGRDGGIRYAVTELLEGETLRRCLDRGALPWRKAVEIAAAIADGLAAAHSKDIVHRDLKPENLFLTSDGHVKILDFGLARRSLAGAAAEGTAALTQTSDMVMGTVGYMSPEQIRANVAKAPSDIFSFGCVLYEMLAGRRAFMRETAAQTMTDILERDPSALSESGVHVPEALQWLVARCLEKSPDKRIQSARDLASGLRHLLGATESATRLAFLFKPAVLILVACVVLAAGSAIFWVSRSEQPLQSIAILPFSNASGNADMEYLSDGITESLINSLSQLPTLAVMSRNSVFRFKGRESDAQAAGRKLNVRTVLTGRVMQRGDNLSIGAELIDVHSNRQLWGETYTRRLSDILALQEEISTEISEKLRFRLTGDEKKRLTKRYTQNTEAYQLYLKGNYYWHKRTLEGFNKGIDYLQQAIDADPNFAPAYAGLADLYTNMASYNYALMRPQEALAKVKSAAGTALRIDGSLAVAHGALAFAIYEWEWDWPSAEAEFKRAVELDPGLAGAYHWYAHYLMTMGRVEESYRAGRRGLELDPLDMPNNAHQGWHYLFLRQYPQAIELLKKTIDMDPNFPVTQWYLGLAYEKTGDLQAAIAQFESCVKITGGRPAMLALLGHAYAAANRTAEARAILDRLNTESKKRYVPSYPTAAIYAALDEKPEALKYLERAHEERDSWMPYIALDPRLDNLRSEPRFHDLLGRMRLGP